ncbi:MAG: PQQ-like beta-propeller repeat protein [Verrucomicrobia bacterium]|nr:PQQ-like beta-propeller repeat protein [Verrucomicrobiota bacterium]
MQPHLFHTAGLRAGFVALAVSVAAGSPWQPAGHAAEPGLIASPEPGWAQWRGPRRDGICDEQGLRPSWPEGGPPRLWTAEGMGRGYSAPIVVGDRLYLTGDFEERLEIIALDLAGRELWRATNGLAWRGQYPGSRSSCTYAGGRLFHKNAHGRVAALDPDTGRELWAVETLDQFDGRNITWGLSESLLVDGDRVIATVGGSRALMAAFDVRSGQMVWSSPPLRLGEARTAAHERVATPAGEADSGSYTSPILAQLAGRRQLVNCSLRHVFGVDADTGELLWSQPFPTRFSVIAATPVLVGDGVFVTAPDAGAAGAFGCRAARKGSRSNAHG